jgi:predicted alpha/beta-fold hydrolase
VVHAQNDPLVPASTYQHPAFLENPYLKLLLVEHGGHLGFLSREKPRFWVDGVALDWMEELSEPGSTVKLRNKVFEGNVV